MPHLVGENLMKRTCQSVCRSKVFPSEHYVLISAEICVGSTRCQFCAQNLSVQYFCAVIIISSDQRWLCHRRCHTIRNARYKKFLNDAIAVAKSNMLCC